MRLAMRLLLLGATAGLLVAPVPVAGAADRAVFMKEHEFNPTELNITMGDTVTWSNIEDHDDQHTVTSKEGLFDSGLISPGQTFSFKFSQAGNFPYLCQIHDGMVGIVRVREPGAPFAADDSLTVESGSAASLNVLANDADPEGDPLSVTNYDRTSAEGRRVACTSTGECTYTAPYRPCPLEDSFSYTISDGRGHTDSARVITRVRCGPVPPDEEKSITLSLKRHLTATGKVGSRSAECTRLQPVTIQRKVRGKWKPAKSTQSGDSGAYKVALPDKPGVYRASTAPMESDSGGRCLAGLSSVARHRH